MPEKENELRKNCQALWNEYSSLIKGLSKIVDEVDVYNHYFDGIYDLLTDTPEMADLRNKLKLSGINIE